MARSRAAHQLGLFRDRDVLHTLGVAAAACALSAGLVYVAYFVHVLRIARTAPCEVERGDCVLLFGKHAPGGRVDTDFSARLQRAAHLWQRRPPRRVILLGGGPPEGPSEAELAQSGLIALGIASDALLVLEAQSRDTLQNLRNARTLLRADAHAGPVTLLSSRYHLARCALFARQLGIDAEVCAAEPALGWRPATLWRIAGEAAYVCWADLGTRWARLIGNQRMLARVT
jgi:vancomycin permeability regulator SanA